MRSPAIIHVDNLVAIAVRVTAKDPQRRFIKRPVTHGDWRWRLWAAWSVFTGRADALRWPE